MITLKITVFLSATGNVISQRTIVRWILMMGANSYVWKGNLGSNNLLVSEYLLRMQGPLQLQPQRKEDIFTILSLG